MGDYGPGRASENGLAPVKQNRLIGSVGNVAHQAPKWLFQFGPYELAIVEFDDQGVCHDPGQMQGLAEKLSDLRENGKDVIIVVFVHGWKHDARSDDENLRDFRHKVLEKVVNYEEQQAKDQDPPQAPRPVLGVFVGWRGLSLYDGRFHALENITFWWRQAAGRRVATGSVRELFGHLRYYHKKRKEQGGSPLFIVVGHSFGGMIVYSALAQSLIEAAATPEVPPSLADLVLLVNPAIEAARYLPIHALVNEPQGSQAHVLQSQPPIFVCVTSMNDWATRFAFRAGNLFSSLVQKAKNRRQRQAIRNTIGHVPWMKTHDLTADSGVEGGTDYKLLPPAQDPISTTPFWVVRATPEVIDGHGGIFKDRFLYFIAGLVFRHADDTTGRKPNMELQAHALAQRSS